MPEPSDTGPLLGEPLLDEIVPAGGLTALRLESGRTLRVVDLQGKQVVDIVVSVASDPTEQLSCVYSTILNRCWRLTAGHILYTNRARPLFTITADTVGLHYAGGGFCTEEVNFLRYGARGTKNCGANLQTALHRLNVGDTIFSLDACFNINMNLTYQPDGSMALNEPLSRPGDYIDLRAELDCVVALSNCPQDRNPCNGFHPTPVRVMVLPAE
jgi:hypothetical protein